MKRSVSRLCFVLTIVFMIFRATTAAASFINFSELTRNGEAAVITTSEDGKVLRLVSADDYQHGSAFSTTTLNTTAFSTAFEFRLSNAGGYPGLFDGTGSTGGDGFVFVIQPNGASSIGGTGGTLAYEGMQSSVGVEFDTWQNYAEYNPSYVYDPNSNHLGIDTNGNVISLTTVNVNPDFDDGNRWYAWIDYTGTTLEVRTNETGTRPVSPLLSYNLDITQIMGSSSGYVGFTAATGGAWENQDIVSWQYLDHYSPIGVPEPGMLLLFGCALIGLAGTKRLFFTK